MSCNGKLKACSRVLNDAGIRNGEAEAANAEYAPFWTEAEMHRASGRQNVENISQLMMAFPGQHRLKWLSLAGLYALTNMRGTGTGAKWGAILINQVVTQAILRWGPAPISARLRSDIMAGGKTKDDGKGAGHGRASRKSAGPRGAGEGLGIPDTRSASDAGAWMPTDNEAMQAAVAGIAQEPFMGTGQNSKTPAWGWQRTQTGRNAYLRDAFHRIESAMGSLGFLNEGQREEYHQKVLAFLELEHRTFLTQNELEEMSAGPEKESATATLQDLVNQCQRCFQDLVAIPATAAKGVEE